MKEKPVSKGLVAFLENQLPQKEASEVIRLLAPFYLRVAKGKYFLSSADNPDPGPVKEAVAQAVNQPVAKIAFVSLSKPFPCPDWMTPEGCRVLAEKVPLLWDSRFFWEEIAGELSSALSSQDQETVKKVLVKRSRFLGNPLWDALMMSVSRLWVTQLGEEFQKVSCRTTSSLWAHFQATLGQELMRLSPSVHPDVLGSFLMSCVRDILFYFLGFKLVSSPRANQLQQLIKLLPDYLLLGNKRNNPHTWLVVTG